MKGPLEVLLEREPTLQDIIAGSIMPGDGVAAFPSSILIKTNDTHDMVLAWSFEYANRVVGPLPVWLKFYRADESNGLLAILHSPVAANEADLIVMADRPGMLTASVLRCIAGWAFGLCGLKRIAVRIPVGDDRLKDFARRIGFRHEGVARDFYGEGADASVWSMLARECRWLGPQPAPATQTINIPAPSNVRKH